MTYTHTSIKYFSSFLFLMCLLFTPFLTSVKTIPTATFDASSLVSNNSKPTISGTATDAKTIQMIIYKEDSQKVFYKKTVSVKKRNMENKNFKKNTSRKL